MRKLHLSPSLLFKLYKIEREKIDYAFSFDYKSLALTALKFLKNSSKIINFAGLNFYQGIYKDKKVIVANGGTYAPDTAMGTEILCFLGAKYLIRMGSCGGLKKEQQSGDLVLADSSLDYTGVTKFYPGRLNISLRLNEKIEEISGSAGLYKGRVCSYDAIFRETEEIAEKMIKKGSIAVDMALSAFLKVAGFYKREAAGLLVISDNLKTGEIGFKEKVVYEKLNQWAENILEVVDLI